MIKEHLYASYYWLTLQNFSKEEFDTFVEKFSELTGIVHVDGIDREDNSICLTFSRYKPKPGFDEVKCKTLNEIIKKDAIKAIRNSIGGHIYFNAKRGVLKKLR